MKRYESATIAEFLGDSVIYRSLEPLDNRLPGLREIQHQVGIQETGTPRKTSMAYARVIAHLLELARALESPKVQLERLVYIGDTMVNDGTAFGNICQVSGWRGMAFIGAEKGDAPMVDISREEDRVLYQANRWGTLYDFDRFCSKNQFRIDERTAVIVDLDKTALGARGRNDRIIDRARIEAAHRTVEDALGEGYDRDGFQRAYQRLNRREFHPFTTDNQDYLVYICMILLSSSYDLEGLISQLQSGETSSFMEFIVQVDTRIGELPPSLRAIHEQVYHSVRVGDPTPFKTFRYNEYIATVSTMGDADPDLPLSDLLQTRLVITQEVRQSALAWKEQGALLFGLSDKPDEASLPTPELAARGFQGIHKCPTVVIGG